MSLQRPPTDLARAVESLIPGAYSEYFRRLNSALAGMPVTVTSWWRSRADNERVGGASGSQHLLGFGVDLVFANAKARATGLDRLRASGLVVIDEGDHLHVQAFTAGTLERAGIFRRLGLA